MPKFQNAAPDQHIISIVADKSVGSKDAVNHGRLSSENFGVWLTQKKTSVAYQRISGVVADKPVGLKVDGSQEELSSENFAENRKIISIFLKTCSYVKLSGVSNKMYMKIIDVHHHVTQYPIQC